MSRPQSTDCRCGGNGWIWQGDPCHGTESQQRCTCSKLPAPCPIKRAPADYTSVEEYAAAVPMHRLYALHCAAHEAEQALASYVDTLGCSLSADSHSHDDHRSPRRQIARLLAALNLCNTPSS